MPDYKALEKQFQQISGFETAPGGGEFSRGSARGRRKNSPAPSPPDAASGGWRRRAAPSPPRPRTTTTARSVPTRTTSRCPKAGRNELPSILGTMTSLGYLKMEEVPGIPVVPETPKAIVYAPLGDTPVDPDVVLFAITASKLMLLEEAALRAGARVQAAAAGAAHLHGDSGGDGARHGDQRGLHRQSRVHADRRRRDVRRDPGASLGTGGAGAGNHRGGQPGAGRASSQPATVAVDGVMRLDGGATVESKYQCESRSAGLCWWLLDFRRSLC